MAEETEDEDWARFFFSQVIILFVCTGMLLVRRFKSVLRIRTTLIPNTSSGHFSLRIPDPALGSYYKKNHIQSFTARIRRRNVDSTLRSGSGTFWQAYIFSLIFILLLLFLCITFIIYYNTIFNSV
jgi:hypothetical protein